jgi:hypothetical protein
MQINDFLMFKQPTRDRSKISTFYLQLSQNLFQFYHLTIHIFISFVIVYIFPMKWFCWMIEGKKWNNF